MNFCALILFLNIKISSTDVDRFPLFEKDTRESNTNSIERERARSSTTAPLNVKLQDHNHNREVIFALPSLQLHFKTEHLQPAMPDMKSKTIYEILQFYIKILISQSKNRSWNAVLLPNLKITFS